MPSVSVVYKTWESFSTRGLSDYNGGGMAIMDVNNGNITYLPTPFITQFPTMNDVLRANIRTYSTFEDVCAGFFKYPDALPGVSSVVHTHSANAKQVAAKHTGGYMIPRDFDVNTQGISNRTKGFHIQDIHIPVLPACSTNDELMARLNECFNYNPNSCSALVQRHGLFVFGATWQEAKRECESLEKIFEIELA
ncbi:methylthioribulose-1-phosphate dehydratase-like isoform X2 [Contarinia nasturtii]|uniref:methylthioribulose-1-phosphate dehydratase-like isoform X2 n=1 Tax=Contarinia nasturtii TaxID=265458 RepID=UPI0012D44143|nr:methylthioribulose-1-phosphate dehydratase-like isoform X2 [Contarinia nasturtii]